VGQVKLGGLTTEEAQDRLNSRIDEISRDGISFRYRETEAQLLPVVASLESDLAYQIFTYKAEEDIEKAFSLGRSDNPYRNLTEKFRVLFTGQTLPATFTANAGEISDFLKNNFSRFETPAQNASLAYSEEAGKLEFSIEEEEYGQVLDYKKAMATLGSRFRQLNNEPINLQAGINYPTILKKDALNIESRARAILDQAPLEAVYEDKIWKITKDDLLGWLELQKNQEDKIMVDLKFNLVKEYLEESVSPEVNIEPIAARFNIEDGRVTEFQDSREGRELDVYSTYLNIRQAAHGEAGGQTEIVVSEKKSDIQTEDANDLGIKDKLGTGHSNFAGSPPNRVHNIQTGANKLHGLLIKPGEEFSLVGALGDIDKEAGYLPELVIKDNKTVPEYGGGLCQIGTTMFRATYASGLPVTERRNHSYRVSYYEPAGTDATIYDPWPDYRFENDTPANILIQARIEGTDLYFDFWGTDDGRVASHTEPVIYNIVRPGPTRYIETADLAPGAKKCTEHAHNGADAYFDYQVKYPDGEIVDKRFTSHYVPWREVCLMGKQPQQASSTEETAEKTDDR
jgi:vancomycin resistance protein YoaR